ncbi:MAG: formate dehydrogenase accessory sulfurtransferase FdhD [bacterium]
MARTYSVLRAYSKLESSETIPDEVAIEHALTISLNGAELVGIQCSPCQLRELVVGFLFGEGILEDGVQLADVVFNETMSRAAVTIDEGQLPLTSLAQARIQTLTSACGRAITFASSLDRISLPRLEMEEEPLINTELLATKMRAFMQESRRQDTTGCLHRCALLEGEHLAFEAQDIGRHNAMDKVVGHLLVSGRLRRDSHVVLTTGRISSDFVQRAARAKVAVLASRAAPTSRAIDCAASAGITLVGFLRGDKMNIYAHPQRIAVATEAVLS